MSVLIQLVLVLCQTQYLLVLLQYEKSHSGNLVKVPARTTTFQYFISLRYY